MNESDSCVGTNQGGNFGDFVRMPWAEASRIFMKGSSASSKIGLRWDFIVRQLGEGKSIQDVSSLINVIANYNTFHRREGPRERPQWKCHALEECFEEMSSTQIHEFFCEDGILSTIRQLVIKSKEIVPEVKLLKSGVNGRLSLHKYQVAALLANGFLCTFALQSIGYPTINFNRLFEGEDKRRRKSSVEKIKCLLNYFRRVKEDMPTGFITYHRICTPIHEFPDWEESNARLTELVVKMKGNIEDQNGYLQMDFANKYVGGGILGGGSLQEEIRFAISPELIAARLFTQCLGDNEALLVVGTERYSSHSGFGGSFRFAGDFRDTVPFDDTEHKMSYVIMLDALNFSHPPDQYVENKIIRELNKAYTGFQQTDLSRGIPLATGNWGCGAFRGDPQLKFLIQLIACSQAGRRILYLTYGNFNLKNSIQSMYNFLKERQISVGTLYRIIREYRVKKTENQTLFEFVTNTITNDGTRTDVDQSRSEVIEEPSASGPSARKSSDSDLEYGLFGKRIRTSSASDEINRTEEYDLASTSGAGGVTIPSPSEDDVEMLDDSRFASNCTGDQSLIHDSEASPGGECVAGKNREECSELTSERIPKDFQNYR
ncbi:UNVERIFIED_CONTAM: hypothetical protein PYX00_010463 [Menopon gallinae]|uniref:poly(ADP-ribose) glycohydrolase n=1 Tax=Menopon gallinae TaxID=328185 RepID=A0AAW2HFH4_9NEOP